MKKKVLLLGSTGRVGQGIIEEYLEKYEKFYDLILGYHKSKPKYNLESRKVDLSDINNLKKAMEGIKVVVNLAAESNPEADFSEIVKPNLIGAYNVFQASKKAKVERVVFASSVHAVRGYSFGREIGHDDAPKPSGFYGASKVFGEALCYVYSQNSNLSCLAIRIGAYVSNNQKETVCFTRNNFDYVITQKDMAQLIHKCILAPKKVKYGILAGISNNKKKYLDLKFTRKLVGYNPEDDAFRICREVKRKREKKE
ncbi:MAG TPA: NAD(P)-dependent oxidoreductase [Candidatus Nanoarchaeia archaeon]|nr:NAD(P)-dependent oxidoreductase [Candidatus Nanoarchaeia archaeon]